MAERQSTQTQPFASTEPKVEQSRALSLPERGTPKFKQSRRAPPTRATPESAISHYAPVSGSEKERPFVRVTDGIGVEGRRKGDL